MIIQTMLIKICTDTNPEQIISCDRGDIKDGLFALPALKILEIRLVFVNKAAYTTVKQKPAANLSAETKLYLRFS